MKVCIVGASGKLGQYMIRHALDRGYEVVGVCREQSVGKLDAFKGRITIVPGATNDREVIRKAVAGCDGVLTVLAPWGVQQYSTGTAQAVLDYARPDARVIFSCGWHITRDGKDQVLVEAALVRADLRPARAAGPVRRSRRSGRGVPPDLRERPALDGRPRQRPRGRRERGAAGLEPACRRPDPREQPDQADRLRPLHGRCPHQRHPHPRSTGHCRLPDALGPRSRRRSGTLSAGAAEAPGDRGFR